VGLGAVESEPLIEGDTVRQSCHGVVERQLMNAVSRFRSHALVDDIGRNAVAHDEQNQPTTADGQEMRRQQAGRQGHGKIRHDGGRSHQRVMHRADHDSERDRASMTAPRVTGDWPG